MEVIERLMSDDVYYAVASSKAREAGAAFIREYRGRFGEIVEELWERGAESIVRGQRVPKALACSTHTRCTAP